MADSRLEVVLAARDMTQKAFTNVNDRLKRMANNALSLNSILITAAGATGGMALMVRESLRVNDVLAKTADKLGIGTEALAGLQHAAELTGVQTATLNMGLQRMVRRVAEAAQGTGEAQGALRELGLDAAKLTRMSPDQAFARIAERMADVSNQGDRVRLAMKLFDSEGVALVNTLKLGSEGLAEAAAEAERLGIAMGRDAAAQIEAANDASLRLNQAMKGVGNTLTVAVAPAITSAADGMADWVAENNRFIKSGIGGYFADIAMVLRDIKAFSDGIDFSAGGWLHWENLIPGRGALNLYKRLRGIGGGDAANDAAMGDLEAGAFPPSYFRGAEAAGGAAAGDPAVAVVAKAAEMMDAHVQAYQERLGEFAEARRTFLAESDTHDILPLVDQDAIARSVTAAGQATDAMIDMADRASWGMTSAFSSFFDVTSEGFLELESLAMGFSQSIARALSDQLAASVIGKAGGGGLLGLLFAQGGVFDQGGLVPFARGGVVTRPHVFPFASGIGLMGEAGPEAIMPLTRTAGGELGVKSQGGQPVQVINISAVDAESFHRKLRREGAAAITEVITQNILHNSSVRSVIRGTI